MKKILFFVLVIIFLLNINVLFSQDNTSDNNYKKYYEISIGGGASLNVFFGRIESAQRSNNFGSGLGLSIPFSTIFFINNFFGCGFSSVTGLITLISMIENVVEFDIFSKLNFVNKIGNINKKHFIYLEYGISLNILISPNYDDFYSFFENSDISFYIGPNIYAAYNWSKEEFNFIIGLSLCTVFLTSYLYPTINTWNNSEYNERISWITYPFIFTGGIELRWLFNFRKPMK